MFTPIALRIIAVLLLLFLATRQTLPALLCTLMLLAGGLAALWNRWALARVEYSAELSAQRAFPGDEIELALRVANRKPLPLTTLMVRELVPAGLRIEGESERVSRDLHGRQVLSRPTSLLWYEALTWRYRLRCLARGAYRLGPARLEAGDPFGFYTSAREPAGRPSLLVYPLALPLAELRLPQQRPLGALAARQLVRDPLRTVGVRDYHPDDPLKDVHWPATARVGALQTRVYEPTTSRALAIFLDLDTFERYWEGIDEAQVERLISAAATLAEAGLREGYAVGLYANGAPAEHEQLARLPPSRSPAQFERIMETLARLTAYSITPMARLLRLEGGGLPWGATLLLLSAIAPEATRAALCGLRDAGRSVAWLSLAEVAPPPLPGVTLHHAPPVGDWGRRRERDAGEASSSQAVSL